jgi:alpha-beta hydrolase superfamily lysophospholipase
MDHPGHGRSEGRRVYVERFEDFAFALDIYLERVLSKEPGKPVFLIGHSMGGLIGAGFLPDHQSRLAGAVLSAPTIKIPETVSAVTILAGKVFSALVPGFGVIRLDADGVSSDMDVVRAYVNDPLVHTGKITARLAAELLKAMKRIFAEADRITLPVMILQGGADRMVDPEGARMFRDRIGSSDRTLKTYEGFYHEVFNEPGHDRVLKDVHDWITAHLDA